jgi:P4 family phage/plasmid primase-like protien
MTTNNVELNNINSCSSPDGEILLDITPKSNNNYFVNRIMELYGSSHDVIIDIINNRELYEENPDQFVTDIKLIELYDAAQLFISIDQEVSDILKATMYWYVYNNYQHEVPVFIDQDEKGVERLRLNLISDYIIKKWMVIYWNGIRFIWSGDDQFVEDKHQLEKDIVEILKDIGYSDHKKAEPIVREIIFKISKESSYIRKKMPFDKLSNQYISCQNGIVVRKKKGCIVPNSPAFGFLYRLDAIYDPDIPVDDLIKWFEQIVDKKDLEILKEIPGHILMRSTNYQETYLLNGTGSNGKSLYIKLLSKMIGNRNISHESLQELMEHRFSSSNLVGKLANFYADLDKTEIKSVGKFKLLTGGDDMSAERKFKDRFDFENTAVFLFSGNNLPEIKDESFAWWRRWKFITFPHEFGVNEAFWKSMLTDKNISKLLKIAITAMEAIDKRGGLIKREDAKLVAEMWKKRSSSSYAFIKERVREDITNQMSNKRFMMEYSQYCIQKQMNVEERSVYTRLIQMVPSAFITTIMEHRTREQVIKGIKILTEDEAKNELITIPENTEQKTMRFEEVK